MLSSITIGMQVYFKHGYLSPIGCNNFTNTVLNLDPVANTKWTGAQVIKVANKALDELFGGEHNGEHERGNGQCKFLNFAGPQYQDKKHQAYVQRVVESVNLRAVVFI